MKIITTYFDHPGRLDYSRLHRVWRASVEATMPDAEALTLSPALQEAWSNRPSWQNNRAKMEAWGKVADNLDEPTILMDCDMLVRSDLSSAFESVEHVGLTKRTECRWPINGGVVFLQPTDEARRFLRIWNKLDRKLYQDKALHHYWRERFGGMNQAALGLMLTNYDVAEPQYFPCAKWNACDEDWANVGTATRVVHYKGDLRKATLSDAPTQVFRDDLRSLVEQWREAEAACTA